MVVTPQQKNALSFSWTNSLIHHQKRRQTVSCRSDRQDVSEDGLLEQLESIVQQTMTKLKEEPQQQQQQQQHELSNYYRRDDQDPRDWPLPKNPRPLQRLLKQRFFARNHHKDYEQVQCIDDKLQQTFGVYVYDNPNLWTRRTVPPRSYQRRKQHATQTQQYQQYGPTGHNFQLHPKEATINPITCRLSMVQIHNLLAKLQYYQQHGQHQAAQALRYEAKLHGLVIHPTLPLWRADGITTFVEEDQYDNEFATENPTASQNTKNKTSISYHMHPSMELSASKNDNKFRNNQKQRILQLVQQRADAMVRGDDTLAFFLKLELFHTYQIIVDDASRTFRRTTSRTTAAAAPTFLEQEKMLFSPNATSRSLWIPLVMMKSIEEISMPQQKLRTICQEWCYIGKDDDEKTNNKHLSNPTSTPPLISPSNSSPWEQHYSSFTRERIQSLLQQEYEKRQENKLLEASAIEYELEKTYCIRKRHIAESDTGSKY
jgi:hypothetical protein